MKDNCACRCACMLVCLLLPCLVNAQDQSTVQDDAALPELESLAEQQEQEPEDDQLIQQLVYYHRHPLHLNSATADELSRFPFLTALQVHSFLQYRRETGPLISNYELQAIPDWDPETIRKLLPYIRSGSLDEDSYRLKDYFSKGEYTLLGRYNRMPERSKGYLENSGSHYLGSPDKFMLRGRYSFSRHLDYGITAEKDAGEQFFQGAQSAGFDFYSLHFFLRNYHVLKALAIGDFTVNMGQGLINWQSLAFSKSSLVMGIKREADLLRPYTSAGEVFFYRGAGVTLQSGHWEGTAFISYRLPDANMDTMVAAGREVITSFITSGNHRSALEIAAKNATRLFTVGSNITYHGARWQAGINYISHHLANEVHKRDELYNLYAFAGDHLSNISIAYAATLRNAHFFGEAAVSSNRKIAVVNGVLASVAPVLDIGLLYRHYDKAYHALYPDAFGEGSGAANESGVYTAASLKLHQWQLNAYADIFRFPWLRYRVDAPSSGADYLLQLIGHPSAALQVDARYHVKYKQLNAGTITPVHQLTDSRNGHARIAFTYQADRHWMLKGRTEFSAYKAGDTLQHGRFASLQGRYSSRGKWAANGSFEMFGADGYDARIYAYESDVLYAYSIPFFYTKGYRYYLNVQYKFSRQLSTWIKWAQTIYRHTSSFSSGLDEVQGNIRSSIACQVILKL